jgi:micrococcal nuclease
VAGCVQDDKIPINISNPLNSINLNGNSSTNTPYNSGNGNLSGQCTYVVDGDTIDVEGVGRVRFVGVNTPERGEPGYSEAKDYVKNMCLYKTVTLDVDDRKNKDKYDRTLAVVYVGNLNLNQELLKKGLAEVMYIPPSEFNPYSWN